MSEEIDISPASDGGVLKKILETGKGDETPPINSIVTVHYEGRLLDGTKFDSSYERNEKFTFTLGQGQVIKGWDIGVATMKLDEKCQITCKAEYGYGKAGSPPKIPPDATLVFDIQLFSWELEDLTEDKSGVTRCILEKGESNFAHPAAYCLCRVDLKGMHEGRVFDERQISFNLNEGRPDGIPSGVELALLKMQKGEKSRLILKPKHGWPDGNAAFKIPPNATLTYEVRLIDFERDLEAWDMELSEKIQQANFLKTRATEFFKKGEYVIAKGLYAKAATYIDNEKEFGGIEEALERNKTMLAIRLNMGLLYLKMEAGHEAKNECDEALKIEATNVKGLFRRGQALLQINEPEAAKADFEQVLALEPTNKAAEMQLTECRKKMITLKAKEKQIYKNMFEKFARKDEEKEISERAKEPDTMSKLGEWGQDAREGTMTNFEKENPDVLLLNKDVFLPNM